MSYIEKHVTKARKKVSWNQSIGFRVVVLILLASALVVSVSGYIGYRYIETVKTQELGELATVTANRLSQHLVTPMWDVNYEQVGSLLEAEMGESRISRIVVYDEDLSTVFAGRERTRTGIISTTKSVEGPGFSSSTAVSNGDKTLGRIDVYLTDALLAEELWSFAKGIALAAVILGLALTIVTSFAIRSLVIKPLKRLTENAEQISRGDLRQEIDASRNDEIGYLGATIDRMQYALRVATMRLRRDTQKRDAQQAA